MLKDQKEYYTRRVGGKTKLVKVKYKDSKDDAKECAAKGKKKGYNYRIEPVTDAMQNNHWAGVPYGAKYTVTFW